MTNNREQKQKEGVLKSLAIAGFIGLIIVISWVGIQLVKVVPSAFSSLASLADSVYSYDVNGLTAVSNKSTAAANESLTINWNLPKQAGTFAFSYKCADGLNIDMRDSFGALKTLDCDTNYNIGSVSAIDIIAKSEKNRFTDLAYKIDFIPAGKDAPVMSDENTIAIVNASISASGLAANGGTSTTTTATSTPTTNTSTVATATSTPIKPAVKPTNPTKPVYVEKPVYSIPTSNPNGTTDLSVSFLGSGTIRNNQFVYTAIIDNDESGAIQFAVQNLGNKTSGAWTYTAKLPNGETYTSPAQVALKPNERAVITLGFSVTNMTGLQKYSVTIETTADTKSTNNSFATAVAMVE